MLLWISTILITLLTSYCVYYTFQRREKLTCMAGMMIAMTTGMMSSLALGVILGVLFNHDLALPTIIAVFIGMIAGFLTGRPISLMAAMDGLMAAIMGGMMGAMLGVMLSPNSANLMVLFVDFLFVLIMFILLQLIDQEFNISREDSASVKKPLIANPVFLVAILIFMGILTWGKLGATENASTSSSQPLSQNITTDTGGEFQTATINVSPDGYGPLDIVLRAGVPTKLDFKTQTGIGCLRQVVSDQLNINAVLEENKDNFVSVHALKPGIYQYTCGMGMFDGKITVK